MKIPGNFKHAVDFHRIFATCHVWISKFSSQQTSLTPADFLQGFSTLLSENPKEAIHLRLPGPDIFRYEVAGGIGGLVPVHDEIYLDARVRSDGG